MRTTQMCLVLRIQAQPLILRILFNDSCYIFQKVFIQWVQVHFYVHHKDGIVIRNINISKGHLNCVCQ